jgi:SAM-dependent methyltransferase
VAADWNDPTLWAALYRNQDDDGTFIGYGRRYAEIQDGNRSNTNLGAFEARWANLVSTFGILTTDRVLIAGCAYGFLIEVANDAGYNLVWGIDSSSHIASNRAIESRGDVLFVEDDIRGGGRVRAALRSLTGDDIFDWIISEDVVPGYTVAELPPLLDAAEAVLAPGKPDSNIVHLITILVPGKSGDSSQTWLTLAEWNAVRPAHSWVDIRTFEVL